MAGNICFIRLTGIIEVFKMVLWLEPVQDYEVAFPDETAPEAFRLVGKGRTVLDLKGVHTLSSMLHVAAVQFVPVPPISKFLQVKCVVF